MNSTLSAGKPTLGIIKVIVTHALVAESFIIEYTPTIVVKAHTFQRLQHVLLAFLGDLHDTHFFNDIVARERLRTSHTVVLKTERNVQVQG